MSKKIISLLCFLLLFTAINFSQTKSNEVVEQQIKKLQLAKWFKLTYDASSDMSKIMVFADDFGYDQDKTARTQGFNFGMAFFYQGKTLKTAPDEINLTFWVKASKPQFAANNHWTVYADGATLDLGDARYAAKAGENMEYLNFKISRGNLQKIADAKDAKMKIGSAGFKFLPSHLKVFSGILNISNPAIL